MLSVILVLSVDKSSLEGRRWDMELQRASPKDLTWRLMDLGMDCLLGGEYTELDGVLARILSNLPGGITVVVWD